MGQWSGVEDWSKESFAVTAGIHVFKWAYEKDALVSENDDCAWLDEVKLPSGTVLGTSTNIMEQESDVSKIYPNPFTNRIHVVNSG